MRALLGALLLAASACAVACPKAIDVGQAELLGEWQAQVEGSAPVTMDLRKHPEYAESVRGFLVRDGRRIDVVGDVDDGQLTLEESQDGKRISAVWLGDVVEGSCGREIRGAWKAEGDARQFQFVLRKL